MSDNYQAGGSLSPDSSFYVERKADVDLYEGLQQGEFCYVLNSRQMGKSSLRVRTAQRLRKTEVICAEIDLSKMGTSLTEEQWYAGIVTSLISELQLGEKIDLRSWWKENQLLSPVQKLGEFIETIALKEISQNIAIFVDEIDSVLSLNFEADDFLVLIRSFYDRRSSKSIFKRITFTLVGVSTPIDLIKDRQRTPFNIGKAINLSGFQLKEAQPLAKGLEGKFNNPQAILKEVLEWTGGQPFLTQKVLTLISEDAEQPTSLNEKDFVAQVVQKRVIENWESQDIPPHLVTIRARILGADERIRGRLLGLYQQILETEAIKADASLEQIYLRLSGLVVKVDDHLQAYNPIYLTIFNRDWVGLELGNLRPAVYRETLKAWQDSNRLDESRLSTGKALEEIEDWAKGKSLTDQDRDFLKASRELETRLEREKREAEEALRKKAEEANIILSEANQRVGITLEEERQAKSRLAEVQANTEIALKEEQKAKERINKQKDWAFRFLIAVAGLALIASGVALYEGKKAVEAVKGKDKAEADTKIALREQAKADKARNVALKDTKIALREQAEADKARRDAEEKLRAANVKVHNAGQRLNTANTRVKEAKRILDTVQKRLEGATTDRDKALKELQLANNNLTTAKKEQIWAEEGLKKAEIQRLETQKGTSLERLATMALKQFKTQQLEGLLIAMRSGIDLKLLVKNRPLLEYPTIHPLFALRTILDNIQEKNIIQPNDASQAISRVNMSSDSQNLVIAQDKKVSLWTLAGKEITSFLTNHDSGIEDISFNSKYQQFATLEGNGVVKLWTITGDLAGNFNACDSLATYLCDGIFSDNSEQLIMKDEDRNIISWWKIGNKSFQKIDDIPMTSDATSFVDRKYVINIEEINSGNTTKEILRVWTLKENLIQKIIERESPICDDKQTFLGMSFNSNDNQFYAPNLGGTVCLIGMDGKSSLQSTFGIFPPNPADTPAKLQFSPLGDYLTIKDITSYMSGDGYWFDIILWKSNQIFGLESNEKFPLVGYAALESDEIFRWRGYSVDGAVTTTTKWMFSPDGKIFIISQSDQVSSPLDPLQFSSKVSLWKLSSNQKTVSFSGQKIMSLTDEKISLWRLSGQPVGKFRLESGQLELISPNGQKIAFINKDNSIRIRNLSGQLLSEFQINQYSRTEDLAFSPDSQQIATIGSERAGGRVAIVKLWMLSGQQLAEFEIDQYKLGYLESVFFSPDGKYMAIEKWAGSEATNSNFIIYPVENLDDLLKRGCNWLHDYITHNSDAQKRYGDVGEYCTKNFK